MAENKQKTYWPYMILGFLVIGITLGYWTVKSASSLPIQESNNYMMKYQSVDLNFNDIMEKKAAFDKVYKIQLLNAETMLVSDNINSMYPKENSVILVQGTNHFVFTVEKNDKSSVEDANVSFLLTRPHTDMDDIMVKSVAYKNGVYSVKDINITKPGRYTLELRAIVGDKIGYFTAPAYLRP